MPDLNTRMTLAFVVALIATLSALFIGEVLGQMPCTLCWYQRIAMFPIVVILGIALWREDRQGRLYAVALALAGLLIAGWHSGLYAGLIAEPVIPCSQSGPSCTDRAAQAILGLPIPYLSMASFLAILLLLLPKGRLP